MLGVNAVSRLVVLGLSLALSLVALPRHVHAQADAEAREAEARARFESGRLAFDDGRFDDALHDFELSYTLSERPQLLYNIGQVHDRLRHSAQAVEYFERYLAALPDAENRRAVEARIRLLQEEPAPQPGAAEPQPDQAGPGRLRFTWVALGVSVAAAVPGVVLAVKTRQTYDDLEAGCGATGGCTPGEIDRSGGPRQQRTSRALLGLAGGALAAGVVLFIVERGHGSEGSTQVSIGPGNVHIRGTF